MIVYRVWVDWFPSSWVCVVNDGELKVLSHFLRCSAKFNRTCYNLRKLIELYLMFIAVYLWRLGKPLHLNLNDVATWKYEVVQLMLRKLVQNCRNVPLSFQGCRVYDKSYRIRKSGVLVCVADDFTMIENVQLYLFVWSITSKEPN